ncbi:MAG: hypothetical protein KF914_12660 [Rhizobiaceae bacterium]|nr:hypothetical protein [Rhizobiaceae bacterium]
MDFDSFQRSLNDTVPPAGLTPALAALWWDGKGDWQRAHERAQERDDGPGMHVHAYLHRKEGDLPNAGYWYRRAGVSLSRLTLEGEWEQLVRGLLARE